MSADRIAYEVAVLAAWIAALGWFGVVAWRRWRWNGVTFAVIIWLTSGIVGVLLGRLTLVVLVALGAWQIGRKRG